jgi:xylulokinase
LPVAMPRFADTSVIGAAMLAGVVAGRFRSVTDAASSAPSPRECLDPVPSESAVLDEAYRRYRQLFQALKPVF